MRRILFLLCLVSAGLSAQTDMAAVRNSVVQTALALKGVPYVYGAESPPDALDCSGFIQYVFRKAAGLELPRNSRQQWSAGYPIQPGELRPGDVLVFDTSGSGPSHVALYLGNGSMIQAASEGPQTGVIVSSTSESYWASRLLGARSFLDRPPSAPAPSPSAAPASSPAAPTSSPPAPTSSPPAPTRSPAAPASSPAAPASSPAAPASSPAAPANSPAAPANLSAAPGADAASDALPLSEIGFSLGRTASVVSDRIPTAAGSMLAFTITNDTGRSGSFQIDFYRANADFSKTVSLRHLVLPIADRAKVRLEPYLFDEPGTYRLNVKTQGNLQLMQRSFEVLQIGSGGALQAFTGQVAPPPAIPKGTPLTKIGLIIGAEAPGQGAALKVARGSALVLRVANGTTNARDLELLLYRVARGGGGAPF